MLRNQLTILKEAKLTLPLHLLIHILLSGQINRKFDPKSTNIADQRLLALKWSGGILKDFGVWYSMDDATVSRPRRVQCSSILYINYFRLITTIRISWETIIPSHFFQLIRLNKYYHIHMYVHIYICMYIYTYILSIAYKFNEAHSNEVPKYLS